MGNWESEGGKRPKKLTVDVWSRSFPWFFSRNKKDERIERSGNRTVPRCTLQTGGPSRPSYV